MKNSTPALFLGFTNNLDNNIDFKVSINLFMQNLSKIKLSIICVPPKSKASNLQIFSIEKLNERKDLMDELSLISELIPDNKIMFREDFLTKISVYSDFLPDDITRLPTIYLQIPNDRQLAMLIGKKLSQLRSKNVLLVGLGNITHKQHDPNIQKTNKVCMDFDSWLRVKLLEFDYYAIRGFENILNIEQNEILDDLKHFIPFLFIFGSFLGSDEILDIYNGFEGNISLRSFALFNL